METAAFRFQAGREVEKHFSSAVYQHFISLWKFHYFRHVCEWEVALNDLISTARSSVSTRS